MANAAEGSSGHIAALRDMMNTFCKHVNSGAPSRGWERQAATPCPAPSPLDAHRWEHSCPLVLHPGAGGGRQPCPAQPHHLWTLTGRNTVVLSCAAESLPRRPSHPHGGLPGLVLLLATKWSRLLQHRSTYLNGCTLSILHCLILRKKKKTVTTYMLNSRHRAENKTEYWPLQSIDLGMCECGRETSMRTNKLFCVTADSL